MSASTADERLDPLTATVENTRMDERETLSNEPLGAPLSSRSQDRGSPSTGPLAGRSRRWYQFTVRAVLALVLLAGLLLTGWRIYIAPYRAQADAVELIKRLGGSYQADAAPAWMSRLAGFEVQDVTLVNLADCDTPDEYIEQIVRLPRVRTLVVGGQEFGDEHLAKTETATRLRWLVLDSTLVSDEKIRSLESVLPELTVHRSDRRLIDEFGEAVFSRGPPTPWWPKPAPSNAHPELQRIIGSDFFQQIECVFAENDAEIAELSRATVVREVHTQNTVNDITAEGVARLRSIKGLKAVYLGTTNLTDAMVAELGRLDQLDELHLSFWAADDAMLEKLRNLGTVTAVNWSDRTNHAVTDIGLGHLATLKNLRELVLSCEPVTDAGLAALRSLRKLETLGLSQTSIQGAGLAHLPETIRKLDLSSTHLTDEGLARLPPLRNLNNLFLTGTRITDGGLAHLAKFPQLESLELSATGIHDEGLAHLASLNKLWSLSLDETEITDAGLAHLATLADLEDLSISNTQVTAAGIVQLARFKKLSRVLKDGFYFDPKATAAALPD